MGFLCTMAVAQQDSLLQDKIGRPILPQKGDFALGISTGGLFNFVGNMFTKDGTNTFHLRLINNNSLYGKYFISSGKAIRYKINLSQYSRETSHFVESDFNNLIRVKDIKNTTYSNMGFTVGFEKRRGRNRLQVSYGPEITFIKSSNKDHYTYGNTFSPTNPSPTTTVDFYMPLVQQVGTRITENKRDYGTGIGIRAFTGIEYFIFYKVCIGFEIGLEYMKFFNENTQMNTEYWDPVINGPNQIINETKSNHSYLQTDLLDGKLFILFHF